MATTRIKKLPKDELGRYLPTFTASGNKYRILSPDDGIGIVRWSILSKMSSVLGYGADVKTQLANLQKARAIVNEVFKGRGDILELGVHLKAMEDGIRTDNERRFHFAFYTATIFIVREDEDLTKFSDDLATAKIEDWNNEGYDAADFFFLVLNKAPDFLNPLPSSSKVGETNPGEGSTGNIGSKGGK
jgi:hypothetical protein